MTTSELGYRVSLATYILLLVLDTLRPGFVSSSFSAHLFLIPTFLFALASCRATPPFKGGAGGGWSLPLLTASLLSLTVWHFGSVFGDFRLLLALAAALIPFLVRV